MAKRLFVFEEICTGCQNCEMWCAFAQKKEFNRAYSKIKVAKDLDGAFDMPIVDCIGNEECNSVNEQDQPLCVEMCPTGCLVYTHAQDAYEKRIELHQGRAVQPLFKLIAPWKWPYPWREWNEGGE